MCKFNKSLWLFFTTKRFLIWRIAIKLFPTSELLKDQFTIRSKFYDLRSLHPFDEKNPSKLYLHWRAVIAQWICLCLQSFISCGPGFDSQARHLHFFLDLMESFNRYYYLSFELVIELQNWTENLKLKENWLTLAKIL